MTQRERSCQCTLDLGRGIQVWEAGRFDKSLCSFHGKRALNDVVSSMPAHTTYLIYRRTMKLGYGNINVRVLGHHNTHLILPTMVLWYYGTMVQADKYALGCEACPGAIPTEDMDEEWTTAQGYSPCPEASILGTFSNRQIGQSILPLVLAKGRARHTETSKSQQPHHTSSEACPV